MERWRGRSGVAWSGMECDGTTRRSGEAELDGMREGREKRREEKRRESEKGERDIEPGNHPASKITVALTVESKVPRQAEAKTQAEGASDGVPRNPPPGGRILQRGLERAKHEEGCVLTREGKRHGPCCG